MKITKPLVSDLLDMMMKELKQSDITTYGICRFMNVYISEKVPKSKSETFPEYNRKTHELFLQLRTDMFKWFCEYDSMGNLVLESDYWFKVGGHIRDFRENWYAPRIEFLIWLLQQELTEI